MHAATALSMQRAVKSLLSLLKLASTISGAPCMRSRHVGAAGFSWNKYSYINAHRFLTLQSASCMATASKWPVTLALHSFIARLALIVMPRFVFCDLCLVSPLRVATYAIETWRSGSTLFVTYRDVVGLPMSCALLKVFYHPE